MNKNYQFNAARYGTHSLIAREIRAGARVLDVGCNEGYLKRLAPDAGDFYGIDSDERSLNEAKRAGYKEVQALDLNNFERFVCGEKFNVIVFADILEHLLYPQKALRFFIEKYLESGGRAIVSLPNVANLAVRANLMFGNFDYTENGILDRTHLHLYTRKTGALLVESCGLEILGVKYSSNRLGAIIEKLPFLGGMLGFNLIYICRRK